MRIEINHKHCKVIIMNKTIWIIILLFGLAIVIGALYFNAPTIEISDVHAEKNTTIFNYASGKEEKTNTVFLNFKVESTNTEEAIIQVLGYDKNNKLILNHSEQIYGLQTGDERGFYFDEEEHAFDNLDKIERLEIKVYKYSENILEDTLDDKNLLYNATTNDIKYTGKDVLEIDDLPSETSHKKTGRSYPTESMYHVPEKKNYRVISKPGEPELREYYGEYVPKWGQ